MHAYLFYNGTEILENSSKLGKWNL